MTGKVPSYSARANVLRIFRWRPLKEV